jgi:tetratricopeptide (TPR) repeat protein
MVYDAQGETQKARETVVRLTKADSTHPDGWYLLGRIEEKESHVPQAIDAYRMAVSSKPDFVDAHLNLAFLYRSEGNMPEAVKRFEEVIRLRPEYAEAHLNLGGLYANMGKLDPAEEEYETAVQLKPNLAEAHHSLGLFYESYRKDMVRALVSYRKYIELGGHDERIERIVGQAGR